ncbi:hypothetical protein [Streptomyces sp. NPDC001315]|uniref:hypothetical protein n=1 Tax=Streptomyces sp. NPDC001315 TaxID=3364562 RepID=UPI0036840F5F
MTAKPHSPAPSDDPAAWVEKICARDAMRIITAWDRLHTLTPAGSKPTRYLHHHTPLPPHLIYDLQQVRTACAHPHLRPLTQADLDRALVTAYHALAHLAP